MTDPAIPFDLVTLRAAVRYQQWAVRRCEPWLGQSVLEVGAGIGNMTRWLGGRKRVVALEPEKAIFDELERTLAGVPGMSALCASVFDSALDPTPETAFDTVVSFNVLEHVEQDGPFLARLADLVRRSPLPGPRRLVTVVPAHMFAFGEADRVYNHYRRYSAASFRTLAENVAPDAKLHLEYFNAFGLPGWIVAGRLLKRPGVDPAAVTAFERLCPWLAPVDDFLQTKVHLPFGQSVVGVLTWE